MNKSLQIRRGIYEGLCYEEIFEHLKSDQENHCKKSCNILEFKARYEADGIYMKFRDRDFLDELLNFRYKMWKNGAMNLGLGKETTHQKMRFLWSLDLSLQSKAEPLGQLSQSKWSIKNIG